MTDTQDLLRGELERLFDLDELLTLSTELLGYDPESIGGTNGKGAFARALVERAAADEALEALVDATGLIGKRSDALDKVFQIRVGRELEAGELLGGYKVLKRLDQGGLGILYLAEKKKGKDKERVAIKVIRSSLSRDKSAVARYLAGQRAFARVKIDGAAPVLATGTLEDGRPWVATKFIEGQTLRARLERVGPMHINEARPIFEGVLRALDAMHDRGLVHSDVKSSNVFMVRKENKDGSRGDATGVIADGGVWRLLAGGANRPDAMGSLRIFGNAEAIAPEMARGGSVGASADVYAVGVMLYECLTGKFPFAGESAFETIAQHLSKSAEAPSAVAPKGWVNAELDALVLKSLAKDPAERFANAAEFASALAAFGKPSKKESLDDKAFGKAKKNFLKALGDADKALALEEIAAPAQAWGKVVDTFQEGLGKAKDGDKKALLFRIARIQRTEQKNAAAAEASFREILELDENDVQALAGLEELKRNAGDYEGLSEVLLEKTEKVESAEARAGILQELGQIYERHLDDADNALVAWIQALADVPSDTKSIRAIERIAGGDAERWNEVLSSLNEAVQEPDEDTDAVGLYVLMGKWYAERLRRPDFALPCYGQAIALDATCAAAYDGTIELYERSQSWQEMVQVLESRAAAEQNVAAARDYRAQAADVVLRRLGDTDKAVGLFQNVLADDPTHPTALDALEAIHEERKEWAELSKLIEERIKQLGGSAKAKQLVRLAEVHEDRLDDFDKATANYEAAIKVDASCLDAYKGLERVFARTNNYPKLLECLEGQLELAATARQKIAILEHIGAIQEEEFVDVEKAIEAYQKVVDIDAGNESANPALARLFRTQGRFDDLVTVLERHAQASEDNERKAGLLHQAATALMADVGAPERALEVAERILAFAPEHADGLALVARLKAQAGDAAAAVAAADKLADAESDPTKKVARYIEAAMILEEAGDRDKAIERYKRALDIDEENAGAAAALRRLYAERGDAKGAAELIRRELEVAEGKSRKAQLHAELGVLSATRLDEIGEARASFRTALELDPTCTLASQGLGDLAYAAGEFAEAITFYEPLLARTGELEAEKAREIALRCGDAFRGQGNLDKAQRAYFNARAFAPQDREVLERVAEVTFDAGEAEEAAELYRDLLERFGENLAADERGRYLFRQGDALLRAGELNAAEKLLDEAAGLRLDDPAPLASLAELYGKKNKPKKVLEVHQRRLENATADDERFELLVKVADVLGGKLRDRDGAAKSYVEALELRPDDRNVLTKLMGVYSEKKEWSRLIEIILRIAELVSDAGQLGKYFVTAGSIAFRELKRPDEAADYYEQALDSDPTNTKAFEGLVKCFEANDDFSSLASAYKMQAVRLKGGSPEEQAAVLDALGDLYREKLDDPSKAIEAYEEAQKLDDSNRKRLEVLADVYAKSPKDREKAIDVHTSLLKLSPYRGESYEALRKVYTSAKDADASWCVCQALQTLNLAGPEEAKFFKKHRSAHPANAKEFLSEKLWKDSLLHSSQNAALTSLFAAITPAVLSVQGQEASAYDLAGATAKDPKKDKAEIVKTLDYAAGLTKIALPEVFYREKDAGSLSFVLTGTPAIGVGKGALAGGPAQALAFVAGRHLSYYRPGHLVRHLVPSIAGLRGWVLAAIKFVKPRFPVPAKQSERVDSYLKVLKKHVKGAAKDKVRSSVDVLLGGELDIRNWVNAVDLTADRVGFVLANDLKISEALIKASPEEGVAQDERLKELYLFAVSAEYLSLRKKLGLAIG